MGLFTAELHKLWGERRLVACVGACWLVFCALFALSYASVGESGYAPRHIVWVYDELEEVAADERVSWVEERANAYEASLYDGSLADDASAYDERLASLIALNVVHNELTEAASYPEFVSEMASQGASGLFSIFGGAGSYAQASAALSASVYAQLDSVSLTSVQGAAIELLTQSRLPDVFVLVCAALVGLALTTEEKADGR